MSIKHRNSAIKEVNILAGMMHPNIVSYLNSFEGNSFKICNHDLYNRRLLFEFLFQIENGNLCIVMDYCGGGDLYGKIKSQNGVYFSEHQVLDFTI